MKNRNIYLCIVFIFIGQWSIAQTVFQHITSSSNTKGHISYINNKQTNGKKNMILIVTPVQTKVKNPNEIGVWYNKGKWTIFNQNRKPMPKGMRFNILVVNPKTNKNAFVHTVTKSNTKGHITSLSSKYVKGKKNKFILATNRYGRYNINPTGVWYNGKTWTVFNENKKTMPIGTKFNVLVLNKGALKQLGKLKGSSYTHKVTNKSKKATAYSSSLSTSGEKNGSTAYLFVNSNWTGKYNPHTYGVSYENKKWMAVNQNKRAITSGVNFNVLSINSTYHIMTDAIIAYPYEKPKTETVSDLKYYDAKILKIAKYKPVPPKSTTEEDVVDTNMYGPDIRMGEKIRDLVDDNNFDEIIEDMHLYSYLYKDRNEHVGIYYFLPDRYTLKWNKKNNEEYSVSIDYQSAANGEVIINASLYNEIHERDIDLLEALLSKKEKRSIKLLPMWMTKLPELDNLTLNNYDVDNVNINIPSDFLEEPIQLNWNMNKDIDEIIFGITEAGIAGSMKFYLFGDSTNLNSTILIPIQIKVEEPLTYGRTYIDNPNGFLINYENKFDYPIILEQLLFIDHKNKAHSVALDNKRIEPNSKSMPVTNPLRILALKDEFIDVNKKYTWIKYSLDTDCVSCRDAVKNKILGGISATRTKKIIVEIFDPLSYTDSKYLKLKIRSIQADPKGKTILELIPFKIEQDDQSLESGLLYVSEGSTLQYEYRIELVSNLGTKTYSSWMEATDEDLIVGRAMIDQLFPKDEDIEEDIDGVDGEIQDDDGEVD